MQQAGRQKRETLRQLIRQTDQNVAELSMQQITAVTTCDHRQGDGGKMTDVKSEEEAGGKTGEGKKRGGGVVESKRKRERWRESMFPTRSIQLSIILLQSDDSSS